MKLEDYVEGLYRVGLAVGDLWFTTRDPLAYRLAERLFEVRRELKRELERRATAQLPGPEDTAAPVVEATGSVSSGSP